MPVAIWALVVLYDPDVKAQFDLVDKGTLPVRKSVDLKENGAIHCNCCKTLFVPSDRKVWNMNGYCSVDCSEKSGVSVSNEQIQRQLVEHKVSNIEITCPNGHKFSVMASFAGCMRPCPTCGEKCSV